MLNHICLLRLFLEQRKHLSAQSPCDKSRSNAFEAPLFYLSITLLSREVGSTLNSVKSVVNSTLSGMTVHHTNKSLNVLAKFCSVRLLLFFVQPLMCIQPVLLQLEILSQRSATFIQVIQDERSLKLGHRFHTLM